MKKIIFCVVIFSLQGCAAVKSKIFSKPTPITRFEFLEAPLIGRTAFGQPIQLGAFSGLQYLGNRRLAFFAFSLIRIVGQTLSLLRKTVLLSGLLRSQIFSPGLW